MRILAIIALLSLSACVENTSCPAPVKESPIQTAMVDHTCTAEEMKRVESESVFCNKNTSFFSSYCYGSAIMRNCKFREIK